MASVAIVWNPWHYRLRRVVDQDLRDAGVPLGVVVWCPQDGDLTHLREQPGTALLAVGGEALWALLEVGLEPSVTLDPPTENRQYHATLMGLIQEAIKQKPPTA